MHKPISTAIVAANFTVNESKKFISRCLIIDFKMSRLKNDVGLFSHLIDELIPKSSSGIGSLIGLCKVFIEEGIDDVNQNILPSINETLSTAVLPRVHISYVVLIWFMLKIMKNSELNDEVEGSWNYFRQEAAPVIRQHQSAMRSQDNLKERHVALVPLTLETFAAEVLQCLQGLHVLEPDVIPELKPSSIVL